MPAINYPSSIYLLKIQRFASPVRLNEMVNFLVNDVSDGVYLNLTRFCFSVQHPLCIQKKMTRKKHLKILRTYLPYFF